MIDDLAPRSSIPFLPMARFVLLYHDCPGGVPRPSHCDLMLESGGSLRTWALAELPQRWAEVARRHAARGGAQPAIATSDKVKAERLADHRQAYLEYEGPVSGDRGAVVRLDGGTFEPQCETESRWIVTFNGGVLRGDAVLERETTGGATWRLIVETTSDD